MACMRRGLLLAVLAVLAVLAALAQLAAAWDHEAFFEFNVKPDGQRTVVRRELDAGAACEFVFAATGGTNEDWLMTIMASNDGREVACTVERPDRVSYLYFMSFEAALSTDLKLASVTVENIKSERLLHKNDWDLVDARRIKSLGGFRGSLQRLEIASI